MKSSFKCTHTHIHTMWPWNKMSPVNSLSWFCTIKWVLNSSLDLKRLCHSFTQGPDFDSWGSHASCQNHFRAVSRVAVLTQSMALLKGATLSLWLYRRRPIFLSSVPYPAATFQSSHAWLFAIFYVCSFRSFWLWTFFSSASHALPHFHPVNSYSLFKPQLACYFLYEISLTLPSKTG